MVIVKVYVLFSSPRSPHSPVTEMAPTVPAHTLGLGEISTLQVRSSLSLLPYALRQTKVIQFQYALSNIGSMNV